MFSMCCVALLIIILYKTVNVKGVHVCVVPSHLQLQNRIREGGYLGVT